MVPTPDIRTEQNVEVSYILDISIQCDERLKHFEVIFCIQITMLLSEVYNNWVIGWDRTI